jgi:hypothetical protein
VNAAIIGGGALILTLLVWVILHHARPAVKVEIGVRAWINLFRPPELPVPDDDQRHQDGTDGEGDEDPSAVTP